MSWKLSYFREKYEMLVIVFFSFCTLFSLFERPKWLHHFVNIMQDFFQIEDETFGKVHAANTWEYSHAHKNIWSRRRKNWMCQKNTERTVTAVLVFSSNDVADDDNTAITKCYFGPSLSRTCKFTFGEFKRKQLRDLRNRMCVKIWPN